MKAIDWHRFQMDRIYKSGLFTRLNHLAINGGRINGVGLIIVRKSPNPWQWLVTDPLRCFLWSLSWSLHEYFIHAHTLYVERKAGLVGKNLRWVEKIDTGDISMGHGVYCTASCLLLNDAWLHDVTVIRMSGAVKHNVTMFLTHNNIQNLLTTTTTLWLCLC